MRTRISADSTCDLTAALCAEYDLAITPLYILMGDRALKDGRECGPEDIFAYTEKTGKLCSTAAVSIADYQDFFAERIKGADHLVHFTISSDMSACYQNAVEAARDFPGRVFVVDSRSLSTGIGLLVLDAADMAREGRSGQEIFEEMERRKEKLNVSFVIDTLDYLHKGGRCSGVAALGANLLKISPCIELRGGAMGVGKKYRGSFPKVLDQYVRDRLVGRTDIDYRRIFITDCMVSEEDRMAVRKLVEELADFDVVLHTSAGCTVSNHCGPGCLGILFFRK